MYFSDHQDADQHTHQQDKQHKGCTQGFETAVANIGIRDTTEDFVCIHAEVPCQVAGVFTQNRLAGPSVAICRENIADGQAQTLIAISKNANVANGHQGETDARAIVANCANTLGVNPADVLLASTGVIGRPYPMATIESYLADLPRHLATADFEAAARGIMTTDTLPKMATISIGDASLVGIAKGVGMIEPNMATLLTFFMTDAALPEATIAQVFKRVMDKTFNCLSIDTDTSTSDSAIMLANGLAGAVDVHAFESALYKVAHHLVTCIAKDGEGATKLIEVTVNQASSEAQAKRVAKAVVNSPLVKTAVNGADPNWGRIAMAVGKCEEDIDIQPALTKICFCGFEVFPQPLDDPHLAQLAHLLTLDEITITITLGTGQHSATVWGCDLSQGYIDINTQYST